MSAEEAVRATVAFNQLVEVHPAVEVWSDDGQAEGGYSYFWVVTRDGTAVRQLAYFRCRTGGVERRSYDESGDDHWSMVE
ncbi:hypothetical protein [Urbifossiella limnaea]|uniref:Uncharacterized protein n=1 Tax=Urbifossiella limnaea TaxID=2528023 RepID=A0A517XSW0_9BACT|nr:hypothetical protein [Urbifossiella limnaea]QDU20575.1 hypothetical protein ETAA1_25300 [Urbifossiella limnaea]